MEMAMTTSSDDKQESTPRRGWFSSNGSWQAKGKRPDESSRRANSPRGLAFWLRLLLIMFLINLFFYGPSLFSLIGGQTTTIDLSYSRFLRQVEQGNVTRVTIKSDNSVTGNFKTPVRAQQTGAGQGSVAATQFTSFIPATRDPSLLPLLKKQGVEISAQPVQPSWWQTRSEERRVGKECRSRWSPYH